MTLSDLTRESVLRAMREYDELGGEQFLSRYGFAPARRYRVAEHGRLYDSKAIAGVAHGYATGQLLAASDFSGGQDTVVKALEALGFSFAPDQGTPSRAWLVTTKSDYRRLGGGTKYDDDPASHYSYDSNVANSRQVAIGDRLVFWDELNLIGASTIAGIDDWPDTKEIRRCPVCGTTNIASRKTKSPKFRCDGCHAEFDTPAVTDVEVTRFRTDHRQGWVDLAGLMDGATLRGLTGYSQNSIRKLDWEQFRLMIETVGGPNVLAPVTITHEQVLAGGHAVRQVSVRIGQPAFRAELLNRYGSVCAFTGSAPPEALEACHLYSYADVGRHHLEGGLLLRRDLHRLFDQGLLAVTPNGTIDVAKSLSPYPLYACLHGQQLYIALTAQQLQWLDRHWNQWRSPQPKPGVGQPINANVDTNHRNGPATTTTVTGLISQRDRYRGCLLGGAVGDALGAPVEFLSRDAIVERFGPDGIADYAPAYGRLGAITDDTQMTLFTAEGLIRSQVRGLLKGITSQVSVTAHAYLRWLLTQGEQPHHQLDLLDEEPGWLFGHPELHHRRAPGNTCLSALREMRNLGQRADNNSKGCGGVMRVAPVGLFMASVGEREDAAFDVGSEVCAITHGHPTGQLAGAAFAVLILELSQGKTLLDALTAAKQMLMRHAGHEETLAALDSAERLAFSEVEHHEAIARLGEGWVAEEALAISVYCALVAQNYRHGVTLAINHDGDSDSTGSITGNLLGVRLGIDAIPAEWLAELELRSVIQEIADDLHDCADWPIDGFETGQEEKELVDRIWRKYPGF